MRLNAFGLILKFPKFVANVTFATDDGRKNDAHKSGLNLTKTRVTDCRNVKRVVTKSSNDDNEEVRKVFVKEDLLKTFDEYMKIHCDKSSKLKSSNFSDSDEESLKIFKKQISGCT